MIISSYGYGDIAGPWYSQPSPYYLSQPRVTKEAALQAISRNEIAEADVEPRVNFYSLAVRMGYGPSW